MKILGTIRGQTIELDGPSGLPTDQRVEIEIRPVEGATDAARAKLEETDTERACQEAQARHHAFRHTLKHRHNPGRAGRPG